MVILFTEHSGTFSSILQIIQGRCKKYRILLVIEVYCHYLCRIKHCVNLRLSFIIIIGGKNTCNRLENEQKKEKFRGAT